MGEIWRDIKDYENLYQVSNLGNVKSLRNGKILKPSMTTKKEYFGVSLCKNGKPKRFVIHRLVAIAFIDNPLNYPVVNHKDNDKTNNNVSNLEWCDQSYNVSYSKESKKIGQYDLHGNLIKVWNSIYEAQKTLKYSSRRSIEQCCDGTRKTTFGYMWRYLKDNQ